MGWDGSLADPLQPVSKAKTLEFTFSDDSGTSPTDPRFGKKKVRFHLGGMKDGYDPSVRDPTTVNIPVTGTPEQQAKLMMHFLKKMGMLVNVKTIKIIADATNK